MAKVYLDEINAALSSDVFSSFSNDSSESKTLSSAIENFIDGSRATLVGSNWDQYRSKLVQYNAALLSRINYAAKLGEAIQEALQLLKDYLGDDAMLDSSKLDEYKRQRQICSNSIDSLNAMLNETVTVKNVDSSGNVTYSQVAAYDASEIRAQISLATETLKELDRLIEKIEGLDAVYSQAESILQDAFSCINTFGDSVGAIVPDSLFEYKHVVA